MDRDKIVETMAKAMAENDALDFDKILHPMQSMYRSHARAALSALEAEGLVVVPNDLFVQESNHSWLAIRHRSPRFCLSAPTLDEAKAKYAKAMASYAALGEKGEDNDRD